MKNLFLLIVILNGCRTYEAKVYHFASPVDTQSKEINFQEKKQYFQKNIYADNLFDGARLNDFHHVKQDTFQVIILPENEPINPSPYYAFRLWTQSGKQNIVLELKYPEGVRHRYPPKLKSKNNSWKVLDASKINQNSDSSGVYLNLSVSMDTLWIAAQELHTGKDVKKWCLEQSQHPSVHFGIAGQSKMNRELLMLDIFEGETKKKDIIVILSRQHPPEVTGYLAMQSFIETILKDEPLQKEFRKKYRLLVYPLMNPDGVDLGHWRHNAGGVDLNRDWAYYHQPENKKIADNVYETAIRNKSKVILGIDFHSTWHDIFYTNTQPASNLPMFSSFWVEAIQDALKGEKVLINRSSESTSPVSKNWFLTQFNADGITYEVGDNTTRALITEKGTIAAVQMMRLLIYK